MIHLSVAVALFLQIIFWEILQVGGAIAGVLLGVAVVLGGSFLWWRRKRR